jgi:hypothetical protein
MVNESSHWWMRAATDEWEQSLYECVQSLTKESSHWWMRAVTGEREQSLVHQSRAVTDEWEQSLVKESSHWCTRAEQSLMNESSHCMNESSQWWMRAVMSPVTDEWQQSLMTTLPPSHTHTLYCSLQFFSWDCTHLVVLLVCRLCTAFVYNVCS